MVDTILTCTDLCKVFQDGDRRIDVLSGINFSLKTSERVAIIGQSGSGKTTLLNLLGGLDNPTAGEVSVAGRSITDLNDAERSRWRNQQLGFVFQFHHLLPEFTAVEAVAMPARIAGVSKGDSIDRATFLLEQVGLGARLVHRPAQLSGGERQRVAIARALINSPSCVLMDEPTGNLDPESATQVLRLMDSLEWGHTAFVMVTHDQAIAAKMQRRLQMKGGKLLEWDHDVS